MKLGIKKGNQKKLIGNIPIHYPADRVYLDGDTDKNVQDAVDGLVSKSGDTMTGPLILGSGTTAGELKINDNGHLTTIKKESGTSGNIALTLPSASGYLALSKQIYPVGTIIMSTVSTMPPGLVGMWEQIGGAIIAGKSVYYYECKMIY